MTKTRVGLGLTALMIILVLTFRWWVKPPPPQESIPPSVELVESRLIGRKDGVRQWELLTKSVLQADEVITLSDLGEISIFQDEQPYLSVSAQRATWRRKQDILELFGPVVVEGEDHFRLESEHLIWEGKQATLTSPGPVLINWQEMELRAEEMILETETDLLRLHRNVEIREGQFVFRLQQAVYDLGAERMEFYGPLALETEVSEEHEQN
mgnify:FL=1